MGGTVSETRKDAVRLRCAGRRRTDASDALHHDVKRVEMRGPRNRERPGHHIVRRSRNPCETTLPTGRIRFPLEATTALFAHGFHFPSRGPRWARTFGVILQRLVLLLELPEQTRVYLDRGRHRDVPRAHASTVSAAVGTTI